MVDVVFSPYKSVGEEIQINETSITSETGERMLPKNGEDSPSVEEASSGGNSGDNGPLKKGPWTSAEDAILVEYVTRHGEGNWNAVQKHLGLARCGKSCRLRWANHLRPDLKKGAFTPEEERRIIELHAKIGNKWARMATELPGRTDNEIKNYWNTRIKRRKRAGLPIYPPELCLQTLKENQRSEDFTTFSSGNAQQRDFSPVSSFEIPVVEFKNFELNQHLYSPTLGDIPSTSLLPQGINPPYSDKPMLSTFYPSRRFRGSESVYPSLNGPICDVASQGIQSLALPSAYDNNLNSDNQLSSRSTHGCHSVINGNSSSDPSWVKQLELPSFQTSHLPSLECVDTFTLSRSLSPQNSGLLDAVLYESQNRKNLKNNSCQQSSCASVDEIDTSSCDLRGTQWEAYGDPIFPLSHSSLSFFPRPDFLLASSCFLPNNDLIMEDSLLKDALEPFLGEAMSKQMDTGATSSVRS